MFKFVLSLLGWFMAFVRSRNSMGLEILALRHQISVLKRKNVRPKLGRWDPVLWVFLRRVWSRWAAVLVVVKPGDRRPMASGRISALLVFPFHAEGEGQTQDQLRASSTHQAHGERQSHLGISQNPRRAIEIGLGDF